MHPMKMGSNAYKLKIKQPEQGNEILITSYHKTWTMTFQFITLSFEHHSPHHPTNPILSPSPPAK